MKVIDENVLTSNGDKYEIYINPIAKKSYHQWLNHKIIQHNQTRNSLTTDVVPNTYKTFPFPK